MKNTQKKTVIVGIFAAIGASLCCITPVIAAIGGLSGVAGTFSWLDPFRPWLIGFTVLLFGFAWYQKLKPRPKDADDCGCDVPEKKTRFIQSKLFLGIMTVFAGVMLAFPYYSGVFFPKPDQQVQITSESKVIKAELSIAGMTCTACEHHVNSALASQPGVIEATSSYTDGKAEVVFDQTQVDLDKLAKEVETETGYTVKSKKVIPNG